MKVPAAAYRFISESVLLVEYGDQLDDQVHHQVLALDASIRASNLSPRVETQPTFRSLLVRFDPFEMDREELLQSLLGLDIDRVELPARHWRVPVCFEDHYAEDLGEAAGILGMGNDSVINALLDSPLKLYMYGFAPGFAYLGGLDRQLEMPRRATPRAPMAAGSLMIAGGLAALVSFSMPTGWYVVGRTPLSMFVPTRDPMVPFSVGDSIHLYQVDRVRFEQLSENDGLAGLEAF